VAGGIVSLAAVLVAFFVSKPQPPENAPTN